MKTIAKTLFLICVILMGSLGLKGQKSLLLQDIQPLMAYSSDMRYDVELSAEYRSSSYHFYMEDKIHLKDWMINTKQWNESGKSLLASSTRLEKEKALPLEDWMVLPFSADRNKLTELITTEEEEPLRLEDWMICCTEWKIVRL